ncbi:hypothetical protein AtubIFM56815_004395 [Aspergillus tubingensis]|uniref:Fe2OG dioxygenase domain-containing protein n=1 Tax=Aspergillus tubingensis TaxID=5068 RepID=A0A9W6AZ88_ASPTU|nr:hypothetical protein AtubIFM56815_004395 [Aspergillus tubingensis]
MQLIIPVRFFYVENFGISDQEVRKQFEIARRFYDLPLDERMSWYDPEKYSSGQNLGYRPVTMRKPIMGVYDNLQIYSVPKFDGHHEHVHPPAFQEELRRIETFQRLLSILEHALELPPLTLQQKCQYEQLSQDRLHYMHYAPRTAEEHKKTAHVYSAGHTDLGLFTLLFRQPVAGLQILDAQGEWRWVQTRDNALTVNIGDTLSLLSCQHFKSTVHRVHSPPADQAHLERLAVLYFGKFNDNVYLDPLTGSPGLQRSTSLQNDFTKAGIRMTMGEYSLARQTQNSRCKQPLAVHADGRFEWDPKDLEVKGGLKVTYYD